jgi:hypothetical protein
MGYRNPNKPNNQKTNNMKTDFQNEDRYLMAKERVHKIKGFYTHLLVFILFNLSFAFSKYLDSGWLGAMGVFRSITFYWGIGVFFHWVGVFGKNLIFSKDWENRKIQELIDKDKQERWE